MEREDVGQLSSASTFLTNIFRVFFIDYFFSPIKFSKNFSLILNDTGMITTVGAIFSYHQLLIARRSSSVVTGIGISRSSAIIIGHLSFT